MVTIGATNEGFEISARFRRSVEARIARLEQDADRDEAQVAELSDGDHIRRHMRLVALQRAEAHRMRTFLRHTTMRLPKQTIAF
jgi:hypothetical protein